MSEFEDLRFGVIEDAATLLEMLPPIERIVWPTDPGDLDAVGEALAFIARWAPEANRTFKRRRRELRAAQSGSPPALVGRGS